MPRHGCRACDAGPAPFILPGAKPAWAPARPVRTRHVRIELALDFATRRISGRCELTVTAVRGGVGAITLDAVELEIARVTAGGAEATFHHDGKLLQVTLPAPLFEGEELKLAVEYGGQPRRGLWFIGPDVDHPERPVQAWTQGQDEDARCWFPCLDSPAQKATVEVIARVPGHMEVISGGQRLSSVLEGETRVVHHRLDHPTAPYLVTLVAGEFARSVDRWRDVEVEYFVPPERVADAARSFSRTPRMLELFSELTGVPYPYSKYAQVVVSEFIFGGMENTSATTLTDSTLHDEKGAADFTSEPLTSHELAHQWFGDLLTCREWPHGWLNEGFATYFEVLWQEHAEGLDEADQVRADDLQFYLHEAQERYVRPIVSREFHAPIDVFDRHLYEKGSLVLHELRRRLGEAGFLKAVRHYVAKHRGGNVETVDLCRAVEEATGVAVDRFFDQYVLRPGHPELAVAVSFDEESGNATVTVKQGQDTSGGTPIFDLPLPVRFVVGGAEQLHTLQVSRAEERFVISLPGRPEQALIDPRGGVCGVVKVEKAVGLFIAELTAAPEARARSTAATALGKDGSAAAIAALSTALCADPFWGTRAAAAAALGSRRTAAALALLAGALGTERHPKSRRALAKALGAFRGEALAEAALAPLLRGDGSWFVEGEAARSLGSVRTAGAFDLLAAALAAEEGAPQLPDAPRGARITGILDGLGKLRDERALPLLRRWLGRGRQSLARRAAIAALGELGRGKREITDELTELLHDPDFRVKATAAAALGELGDEHAAGALGACAERDLDGRVRRICRESAARLRKAAVAPVQLAALRDELELLKGEVARLREEHDRRG